jgi:hypothetical protein
MPIKQNPGVPPPNTVYWVDAKVMLPMQGNKDVGSNALKD